MDRIVAYCGIVCSGCPGYVATQANDRAALERLAEQARKEHNLLDVTVQDVMCDGCLDGVYKCGYCAECAIRACGEMRAVANCAHCSEYTCEKLEGFLKLVPDARSVLDEIRRSF
jgi:hypothetical protein